MKKPLIFLLAFILVALTAFASERVMHWPTGNRREVLGIGGGNLTGDLCWTSGDGIACFSFDSETLTLTVNSETRQTWTTDDMEFTADEYIFNGGAANTQAKVISRGNNQSGAFIFDDTRTGGEAGSLTAGTSACIFEFSDTGEFQIHTATRANILANPGGGGTALMSMTSNGDTDFRGASSTFEIDVTQGGSGDINAGCRINPEGTNDNLTILTDDNGTVGSIVAGVCYGDSTWNSMWEYTSTAGGTEPDLSLIKSKGRILVPRDSAAMSWGAVNDAYIEFDGNSLNIVANAITATDDIIFTSDKFEHSDGTFDLNDDNLVTTGTVDIGGTGAGQLYVINGADQVSFCDGTYVIREAGTGAFWMDNSGQGFFFSNVVLANTMTASSGSITDSTGAISFGDENLSTTGTLTTTNNLYVGNNAKLGDTAYDYHGINTNPVISAMLTATFAGGIDDQEYHTIDMSTTYSGETTSESGGLSLYGKLFDYNVTGDLNDDDNGYLTRHIYGDKLDLDVSGNLYGTAGTTENIYGYYSDTSFSGTCDDITYNTINLTSGYFTSTGNSGTDGVITKTGVTGRVLGTSDENIGVYGYASGATNNIGVKGYGSQYSYYNSNGSMFMGSDSEKSYWGAANDAYIEFDGDSLNIVATGKLDLNPTGALQINGTDGWTGWFDDGANFRVTVVKGIITAVANSTAGGHNP